MRFSPNPLRNPPGTIMTWEDLAKLVSNMSEEDRTSPVLLVNSDTGAFFGGIRHSEN